MAKRQNSRTFVITINPKTYTAMETSLNASAPGVTAPKKKAPWWVATLVTLVNLFLWILIGAAAVKMMAPLAIFFWVILFLYALIVVCIPYMRRNLWILWVCICDLAFFIGTLYWWHKTGLLEAIFS